LKASTASWQCNGRGGRGTAAPARHRAEPGARATDGQRRAARAAGQDDGQTFIEYELERLIADQSVLGVPCAPRTLQAKQRPAAGWGPWPSWARAMQSWPQTGGAFWRRAGASCSSQRTDRACSRASRARNRCFWCANRASPISNRASWALQAGAMAGRQSGRCSGRGACRWRLRHPGWVSTKGWSAHFPTGFRPWPCQRAVPGRRAAGRVRRHLARGPGRFRLASASRPRHLL